MSNETIANYRQRALNEYGEKCHACGSSGDVVVHHRDGDRSNNELANLIPVCDGCHAKIHNRHPDVDVLVRELGHEPLTPNRTQISVSEGVAEVLYERKGRNERYDDVILRLFETAEGELPDHI